MTASAYSSKRLLNKKQLKLVTVIGLEVIMSPAVSKHKCAIEASRLE
jgi:hypothetical protein